MNPALFPGQLFTGSYSIVQSIGQKDAPVHILHRTFCRNRKFAANAYGLLLRRLQLASQQGIRRRIARPDRAGQLFCRFLQMRQIISGPSGLPRFQKL